MATPGSIPRSRPEFLYEIRGASDGAVPSFLGDQIALGAPNDSKDLFRAYDLKDGSLVGGPQREEGFATTFQPMASNDQFGVLGVCAGRLVLHVFDGSLNHVFRSAAPPFGENSRPEAVIPGSNGEWLLGATTLTGGNGVRHDAWLVRKDGSVAWQLGERPLIATDRVAVLSGRALHAVDIRGGFEIWRRDSLYDAHAGAVILFSDRRLTRDEWQNADVWLASANTGEPFHLLSFQTSRAERPRGRAWGYLAASDSLAMSISWNWDGSDERERRLHISSTLGQRIFDGLFDRRLEEFDGSLLITSDERGLHCLPASSPAEIMWSLPVPPARRRWPQTMVSAHSGFVAVHDSTQNLFRVYGPS